MPGRGRPGQLPIQKGEFRAPVEMEEETHAPTAEEAAEDENAGAVDFFLFLFHMSRPRTMGAGLAGSMTKGVNVNQVQFGDKLQGLAPQATHFFIAGNGRAGWNQYRTRTNGNKRNFVFCMNQLGGVGAGKSQFKIRGLNKPDGTGNCLAGPYSLKDKIEYLRRYFLGLFPNYTLCLVGEQEKVSTDLIGCDRCAAGTTWTSDGYPFMHLTGTVSQADMSLVSPSQRMLLMKAFSDDLVRNMIMYVNSQCSYITGTGCQKQPLGVHTLGLVPDTEIPALQGCGYGLDEWEGVRSYYITIWPCVADSDCHDADSYCGGFPGPCSDGLTTCQSECNRNACSTIYLVCVNSSNNTLGVQFEWVDDATTTMTTGIYSLYEFTTNLSSAFSQTGSDVSCALSGTANTVTITNNNDTSVTIGGSVLNIFAKFPPPTQATQTIPGVGTVDLTIGSLKDQCTGLSGGDSCPTHTQSTCYIGEYGCTNGPVGACLDDCGTNCQGTCQQFVLDDSGSLDGGAGTA